MIIYEAWLIVLEERNSKDETDLRKVLNLSEHEAFETHQMFPGTRLLSATLDITMISDYQGKHSSRSLQTSKTMTRTASRFKRK